MPPPRVTLQLALTFIASFTWETAGMPLRWDEEQHLNTNGEGLEAQSVYTGDFDGDGLLDVVSGHRRWGKIVWYRNEGNSWSEERLVTQVDFITGYQVIRTLSAVVAADLDGDGDTDILSASRGDNKIAWYPNDGAGEFTLNAQRVISNDMRGAWDVLAVDLSGDGRLDVVATAFDAGKIAWFRNLGSESGSLAFSTENRIGPNEISLPNPTEVHAADMDGDGDLDIVVNSWDGFSVDSTIAWFMNRDGASILLVISRGAIGVQALHAADVNADGHTDVLSASQDDDQITLYRSLPNTLSTAPTVDQPDKWLRHIMDTIAPDTLACYRDTSSVCSGYAQPAMADFDADGDVDVAVIVDKTLMWYENDGYGNFADRRIIDDNEEIQYRYCVLSSGDLDRDGYSEIIAGSCLGGSNGGNHDVYWVYKYNGDGEFTRTQLSVDTLGEFNFYVGLLVGKVYGWSYLNLQPDLVTVNRNTLTTYRTDFGGNFAEVTVIDTPQEEIVCLALADLDGDQLNDILVGDRRSRVSWYRNVPTNTAARSAITDQERAISMVGDVEVVRGIATGDLDNDGDIDVVICDDEAHRVAWFKNDGTGVFGALQTITILWDSPRMVYVEDVDGDGNLDVIVVSGTRGSEVTSGVAWFAGDGEGGLSSLQMIGTRALVASSDIISPMDLNGDGKMDVLSIQQEIYNSAVARPQWFENGIVPRPIQGWAQRAVTGLGGIRSLQVADIDADGDLDVVAMIGTAPGGNDLVWFANDGKGGLSRQQRLYQSHTYNQFIYVTDLDGDGDSDIIIASSYIEDPIDDIMYLANDGSAGFSGPQTVSNGALNPTALYSADIDGDGSLDLLVAARDQVAYLPNGGSGEFNVPQRVVTWLTSDSTSVTAGDLDGDGDLDVVSAFRGDDRIAWYENDGRGRGFSERTISSTAADAQWVEVADIDGDGALDVISASYGKIAWYANDGSGGFTSEHTVGTDLRDVRVVHVADINMDGFPDILTSMVDRESAVDEKIMWFQNDGFGNFSDAQVIRRNGLHHPHIVFSADMDGDGVLDVLSTSFYGTNTNYFLNRGQTSPPTTAPTTTTAPPSTALPTTSSPTTTTPTTSLPTSTPPTSAAEASYITSFLDFTAALDNADIQVIIVAETLHLDSAAGNTVIINRSIVIRSLSNVQALITSSSTQAVAFNISGDVAVTFNNIEFSFLNSDVMAGMHIGSGASVWARSCAFSTHSPAYAVDVGKNAHFQCDRCSFNFNPEAEHTINNMGVAVFTYATDYPAVCSVNVDGSGRTKFVPPCSEAPPATRLSSYPTGEPQIYWNRMWLPVCGHHFWNNPHGATTLCKDLGYNSGSANASDQATTLSANAFYAGVCVQVTCFRDGVDDYEEYTTIADTDPSVIPSAAAPAPSAAADDAVSESDTDAVLLVVIGALTALVAIAGVGMIGVMYVGRMQQTNPCLETTSSADSPAVDRAFSAQEPVAHAIL
ncbi:hypothetical protein CYMTET_27155 [Cymbomonas tetramitiformis]|uniref:SRCR domain-containing protein n=1 Tax=Cymbomonas tetramitiformis TaxID=36881 RepID=A0AAE0KX98_9CHLO|nr:hypothetical protein CYMTET_27155 [Cymbomonas tetramitiformis]